ncbi:F-box/FBD/LRR-repeat protein at1g16930 [Phtheirospermum japonicum]|uniref:F-box/FBD/LRR-repeat protein at1g16930 n=1 Tax=Phtheirospermum japonicum TaxID=374723 RepID=A0A830BMF6_9LAMI|nr:F-box/FBD/LRR-repeat protein at1g16930 [Phtheirospermum japonicum]
MLCNQLLNWCRVFTLLKKLHLFRVKYDVGENLTKLFTGCPVLEELIMVRLEEDGLVCCNIFSPTIKMITLDFPYNPPVYHNHEHKVELNTPALRNLRLTEFISTHISSQKMLTSLTEVVVSFDYDEKDYGGDKYFQSMIKFIFSVSNMKCLKLTCPLEFDPGGSFAEQRHDSLRKLDNLLKLELAADWYFLTNFLACADNLEVLIIHEVC